MGKVVELWTVKEGRLSAVALSIFLKSILFNPHSELFILALEDVLSGLDMSSRLPFIKTL